MPPLRPPAPPSPAAVAFAGALSLAVAMGIGRFAFTPMMPLMIRAGELDVTGGGWIAAANYLGYLVGGLSAARLHWPARRLALTALAATALLTAAMALHGSALWLLLRFVAGVASAWAFVGTSVWCLATLADARAARWSSAVYAGVGAGIALTGGYCLLAGALGASASSMWWQLGALSLALTIVVAAIARRLARGGERATPARSPATASLPPGTRGIVWCYAVMGFGYILPATFLPVLARAVVDDPRVFGLAWPLFGFTAVLSLFIAGWWLARVARLRVWAVSQLLMGIGVLLPSIALSGWTIACSALLVGGTFMVVTLAGMQEARALAPDHSTSLMARMTTAFAAGQIAGPVLSAMLSHWPGMREHGLNLSLQGAALALFTSAAWLWRRAAAPTTSKEISQSRDVDAQPCCSGRRSAKQAPPPS